MISSAIPKPGRTDGFRPITLLSCFEKTMERMILKQLKSKTGSVYPNVFRFRRGRSTNDAMYTLVGLVSEWIQRKSETSLVNGSQAAPVTVLIDLTRAFKSCDRLAIVDCLFSKGVSGNILR